MLIHFKHPDTQKQNLDLNSITGASTLFVAVMMKEA